MVIEMAIIRQMDGSRLEEHMCRIIANFYDCTYKKIYTQSKLLPAQKTQFLRNLEFLNILI